MSQTGGKKSRMAAAEKNRKNDGLLLDMAAEFSRFLSPRLRKRNI
jgi:hypothetical protein